MTFTQSNTPANALTSFIGCPFAPANGASCTAALTLALAGSTPLSCCRNSKKFAESEGETLLEPSPCWPGYSQSMSMPSRENCLYAAATLETKVWRVDAVATAGEKYLQQKHHVSVRIIL